MKDKKSGKSLGYGYMEINTQTVFQEVLKELQSTNLRINGRNIVVRDASKKFEGSKYNSERQNPKNDETSKKRDKKAE